MPHPVCLVDLRVFKINLFCSLPATLGAYNQIINIKNILGTCKRKAAPFKHSFLSFTFHLRGRPGVGMGVPSDSVSVSPCPTELPINKIPVIYPFCSFTHFPSERPSRCGNGMTNTCNRTTVSSTAHYTKIQQYFSPSI